MLLVGSLEYGPPPGFTAGQVRGGRWKPLHYFYKNSLMKDVMATCGDLARSKNGTSACLGSTFCGQNRVSMGSQPGQQGVFGGAYS